LGGLRSGKRQKDIGKDLDIGFREAQLLWTKNKRAGISKRLKSSEWKKVLVRIGKITISKSHGK